MSLAINLAARPTQRPFEQLGYELNNILERAGIFETDADSLEGSMVLAAIGYDHGAADKNAEIEALWQRATYSLTRTLKRALLDVEGSHRQRIALQLFNKFNDDVPSDHLGWAKEEWNRTLKVDLA